MEKAKLYKIGNTLVTVTIVFLCFYYLKSAFDSKVNNIDWDAIYDIIISNYLFVFVVICFVPINWGIETLKWKWILKDAQYLSWNQSVKSVLSGITMSIITPNGIGDYGGRMLGIEKNKIGQALFYNGFLSLSQLLTTFIFGLLGLLLVRERLNLPINGAVLSIITMGLICIGFWIFFKSKFGLGFIKIFLLKYKQLISFEISRSLRFQVLFLSFLRYVVFCIQYYLLIQCFNSDIGLVETFSSIAVVYLCTAIIPTGWFSGLIVRGSVSFFVFQSVLNSGEFGVLASTVLWLINLFLPALVGLYYIKSFKLFPVINLEKV
ncbi:MAG: hypothetical protein ACJAV5_000860 [Vicingaceae bacterium]